MKKAFFYVYKKNIKKVLTRYKKDSKMIYIGGRFMKDIFINISEENETFKREFNKDFISIAELIDGMYEVIHARNELEYKLYEKEHPDVERLFEIEDNYDRANGN